jgi:predicted aspartyl protease
MIMSAWQHVRHGPWLAAMPWWIVACAPAQAHAPHTAPIVYDEHGGLFLEAHVKGCSEAVRFILDTGASRSALSEDFAKKTGVPLREGGEVEGSAGKVKSRTADVEIDVPGLGVTPVSATVYAIHSYDPKCVGILGREALAKEPFQLRYQERQIVWGATPSKTTVPMQLDGGIPRISVTVNGVRTDLRLDTGATLAPGDDSYLNLTVEQAAAAGVKGEPVAVWSATGTGDQPLRLPVHKLESARIGERELPHPFAIVQPKVGYFERKDAVGFLGNAVLDKLDPFFDYANGRFGVGR